MQTDGKDEDDQAEFFQEVEEQGVRFDAEGPAQEACQQDPDGSEGNAFVFDFAQQKAEADDKSQDHEGMTGAGGKKEISHCCVQVFGCKVKKQFRFVQVFLLDRSFFVPSETYRKAFFLIFLNPTRIERRWQGIRCLSISYSALFRLSGK